MQARLPDDLNGWVALATGVVALVTSWIIGVWRASAYKASIDNKFKVQGERIGVAEEKTTAVTAQVADIWRKSQTVEYNILALTEGHGEQKARFEALIQRLDTQADRKRQEENDVTDRLARIETQLQIFISIYTQKKE